MPRMLHTQRKIAALASAAGLAASAVANDCRLSVAASPNVIKRGQVARIDTFAHFPASAYAFAASDLDVFATAPAWSAVSDGVVIGDDVLGINAWQDHNPFGGSLADPTNPLRIWSGQYLATSDAPALVKIEAVPTDFYYYPSALTPSSVECEADPGATYLFVNPVRVGPFGAAPGDGTSMEVVGGDIIAEPDTEEAVLIGLLVPAVQKIRIGVRPDGAPSGFAAETQIEPLPSSISSTAMSGDEPVSPPDRMTISFTGLAGQYTVFTDMPGDAEVTYRLRLLGRVIDEFVAPEGLAPFTVSRTPDTLTHELGHWSTPGLRGGGDDLLIGGTTSVFNGGCIVVMQDGSVRFVTSIDLTSPIVTDGGPHVKVFSGETVIASGVDSLTLTPH